MKFQWVVSQETLGDPVPLAGFINAEWAKEFAVKISGSTPGVFRIEKYEDGHASFYVGVYEGGEPRRRR